jgi:hypothetical protein
MKDTVRQAKHALWKRSGLPHDAKGYLKDARLNLIAGVFPEMIQRDYCGGAGKEWETKMRAVHSSAALAANAFGRWKGDPSKLTLFGYSGFQSVTFEARCPTGLGGTPPHLDVLLKAPDLAIGIESKLLEPLLPKRPNFSDSYSLAKLPVCEKKWWNVLEQVRNWPEAHLDAAQLIKHYLGLRRQFQGLKKVILLYLFWKPINAADFGEYVAHEADILKFTSAIGNGNAVQFAVMDYIQLWDSWSTNEDLAEHAKLLRQRYAVEI